MFKNSAYARGVFNIAKIFCEFIADLWQPRIVIQDSERVVKPKPPIGKLVKWLISIVMEKKNKTLTFSSKSTIFLIKISSNKLINKTLNQST